MASLMCDMRTPQLHLRMTGEADEGETWGPYEGGGTFPEQEVSRGSTTLSGPIDQSRPMALKTWRAAPTGTQCSARTLLAVSVVAGR